MSIFKTSISIFCFIVFQGVFAQSVEILGKIESTADVENIHVINKTAQRFTVSNNNGVFKMLVRLNDTLHFSSLQHQPKTVVIDKNIMQFKVVRIALEVLVNALDEVLVGNVLSGNLLSDINNVKGDAPINFFDVGIPGYTGKPATQSERRLSAATGGGGLIPIIPIINAMTGYTKMLKARVRLEEKQVLMQSIKARLAKHFFASNPLEDDLKMDFFYFCADDENFIVYCKNETDFKILIFLKNKYVQYLENLNLKKP